MEAAYSHDSPEGRILAAICGGRWPWSCAVGLVLAEAERTGPESAGAALAGLEAAGWVERWELPAVPSAPEEKDGGKGRRGRKDRTRGGRAEAVMVVLTPWGMSRLSAPTVDGPDLPLGLVEDETAARVWYGWPGEEPDHYELPRGDRMISLSDPRMAAVVAGLTSCEDEGDEFLVDRATGNMAMLFERPIPIAGSWGRAKRADDRAKQKAKGRRAG